MQRRQFLRNTGIITGLGILAQQQAIAQLFGVPLIK